MLPDQNRPENEQFKVSCLRLFDDHKLSPPADVQIFSFQQVTERTSSLTVVWSICTLFKCNLTSTSTSNIHVCAIVKQSHNAVCFFVSDYSPRDFKSVSESQHYDEGSFTINCQRLLPIKTSYGPVWSSGQWCIVGYTALWTPVWSGFKRTGLPCDIRVYNLLSCGVRWFVPELSSPSPDRSPAAPPSPNGSDEPQTRADDDSCPSAEWTTNTKSTI